MAAARAMLMGRGYSLARTAPVIMGRPNTFRPVTTTVVVRKEGFVAESKKMGRPLSPSLKLMFNNPEPVWMLSIAHRVTGMILTPTLSLLAITYVASGSTFTEYVTFLAPFYQSPFMWGLLKFSVVFPFAYHCFNGLRHLYWDTGRGFNMPFTYRAGFTSFVLAVLVALGLAMYTPGS